MYNPGPNFLSAGLVPLPIMYFVYSLVYIAVFLVWVFYCMCGEGYEIWWPYHDAVINFCQHTQQTIKHSSFADRCACAEGLVFTFQRGKAAVYTSFLNRIF